MTWNAYTQLALCSRCVRDPKLHEHIRSHGRRRRCALCGSTVHPTLTFGDVGDVFRDAVNQLYVESDSYSGDSVGYLLQDEFDVFQDHVDPNRLIQVVEQILMSGVDDDNWPDLPDYRGTFKSGEYEWETDLIERVTHWAGPGNEDPDLDDDPFWIALEDMSERLPEGSVLYRARLHDDRRRSERFTIGDLGAPPAEHARPGRANRAGVSVLYTTSDRATAIREVRPWIGCATAVAEIRLQREVTVVDTFPRRIPSSPFFEELLNWKVNLPGLIYAFAQELSRPVGPHEAHRYEATQRMCDIVKRGGYDGVRYPSALGEGSNLVLFDPAAGRFVKVEYVRATTMDLEYEEIDGAPYEDSPFETLFTSALASGEGDK